MHLFFPYFHLTCTHLHLFVRSFGFKPKFNISIKAKAAFFFECRFSFKCFQMFPIHRRENASCRFSCSCANDRRTRLYNRFGLLLCLTNLRCLSLRLIGLLHRGTFRLVHISVGRYRELYEIRMKVSGNMVRVLFVKQGEDIVLLYAFYKRSGKDTEKALETAYKTLNRLR